ncbi:EAL domain-containing protein [Duganella violaceipulchra]|uniref:EAL domain-containing protein n=1 Tax=Duganella violaceipulchra TaxID=2849652 RepID=A0AA41L8K6_9BURK|nr:EAL domain-containing protein [Duganella violaceicalia]MCP2012647.1 EAL domain-containing protein (putative c-di-GMP-specific phosphodiesterase class I) [Duganella violaceicalia]
MLHCKKISASDIMDGLRRREFRAFFQPIVDVSSGRVATLETTVRWGHPIFGLLVPAEFLCEADQYGLLDQVAVQFLDDTIATVVNWRRQGFCVSLDLYAPVQAHLSGAVLRDEFTRREMTKSVALSGLSEFSLIFENDLHAHSLNELLSCKFSLNDCTDTREALTSAFNRSHVPPSATTVYGVDTLLKWYVSREHGVSRAQGDFICPAMTARDLGAGLVQWHQLFRGMHAFDELLQST